MEVHGVIDYDDGSLFANGICQSRFMLGKGMNNLEKGQDDIRLRIGEVAYRFELKELESRVETLERKLAQ